ncbi:MAG: cyclic nucleotide-binding domain-containing protein [Deltaproteobacteria bacterium]|nr:cyclic nucleotide-binding domain-containing protein [Deltaproteobacteria bacterium]
MSAADQRALAAYMRVVEVAAGHAVVEEGGDDRDLYVVLEGEGRILRHGVEVGTVTPGDYFGELALVGSRPRAATITAVTRMQLARMDAAEFDRLRTQDAPLTARLLACLLASVGSRLTDMTDSVRLLLRERSLPRRATVDLTLDGEHREVRMGTPLRDILPRRHDGRLVVAALLGRKPVSLTTPVASDVAVGVVTTDSLAGQRIYRSSLALLLMEAARAVAPALVLRLGESLGGASRVEAEGVPERELPAVARRLRDEMRRLVARDLPLRPELWTVDEALEYFRYEGWSDVVDLLRTWRQATVPVATYHVFHAMQGGPLVPTTADLADFDLVAADGSLVLLDRPSEGERVVAHLARTPRATQGSERWLRALGITHVGAFNRACIDGGVAQMIRVSEGFQEKRVGRIADEIATRGPKIICVAGPSSSGKTTFIRRLRVQLQVEGINPIGVSLDDYYVDRERTPVDEHGELDFEAPGALDLDLLRDHLGRLLQGETVTTARYDFKQGKSHPLGGPAVALGPHDVLMLEGIHGLNPSMVSPPRPDMVYRVFICPRVQLPFDRLNRVPASDVRLLRRIVRDRHGRGISAADNIARWPAVRAGERRHIFPFEQHADVIFDSSLIYELSVLKVYAERYLLEVPQDHPSYTTAFRLLALLDRFVTIYPDHVPPTSFLREFIGGSGFDY